MFETHGSAGELFEKWFKVVMKKKEQLDKAAGATAVSWTAHTSSACWQQRLSIALQKGNARITHRRGARDNTSNTPQWA